MVVPQVQTVSHRFSRVRWSCLFVLLGFVSVGCFAEALVADDWPTGRGNPTATGATSEALPKSPDLLWEVDIDGLGFDAGPIIADGKVFAADAEGRIVALNLSDGTELWRLELETGFNASPGYRDGVVFVGGYEGIMRALEASTGKEKWVFNAEMGVNSSPNFYKDALLFTTEGGELISLKRETGEVVWKYNAGERLECDAALAGNRTFLGGCDERLHVVDVDSGTAVGEPLPIFAPTGSTPSVVGTSVFVPTHAGEILAYKMPDNELLWRFKNDEIASEFKNSIAVQDGLLIGTSRNKQVFALKADTGEVAWTHRLRKRADSSPVIAGETVVIAAADGRIIFLDLKSGEQTWLFEVKESFLGSPAVSDGKLVVANDRGTIFCFGSK